MAILLFFISTFLLEKFEGKKTEIVFTQPIRPYRFVSSAHNFTLGLGFPRPISGLYKHAYTGQGLHAPFFFMPFVLLLPLLFRVVEMSCQGSFRSISIYKDLWFFFLFLFIACDLWVVINGKIRKANLQSGSALLLMAISALKVGENEQMAVLRATQMPLFDDGLEQAATFLFPCLFFDLMLDLMEFVFIYLFLKEKIFPSSLWRSALFSCSDRFVSNSPFARFVFL